MSRALQMAGLAVGVFGLILQAVISIDASLAAGRSLGGSVIFLLSFFTILTNIAAVLAHGASLFGKAGSFFARPGVRAGVAVSMGAVMITYAVLLASTWQPEGLFLLCDVLLHYVTPVIFIVWWVCFGRDGSLGWRHVLCWLIYPAIYLAYALLRAPVAGEVPYPFLDVAADGLASVLVSIVGVAVLFIMLGAAAVFVDRRSNRVSRS